MGKQVTELDTLPSFTDTSLLPVHNGAGLKKGSSSQLANYLGTKFRNPNLLINPDFRINQRGATNYENDSSTATNTYSVDRWSLYKHKLEVNSDKSITLSNTLYSDGSFSQILENAVEGDVTIQIYVADISGLAKALVMQSDGVTVSNVGDLKKGLNVFHCNKGLKKIYIRILNGTITLKYVKAEQGTVATAYVAPDLLEEYPKCQRYFQYIPKLYCVPLAFTKNTINNLDKFYQATNGNLPTEMRTKPTLTYKTQSQSDNSELDVRASFEVDSKSINTITLNSAIINFTIIINDISLDAEIY